MAGHLGNGVQVSAEEICKCGHVVEDHSMGLGECYEVIETYFDSSLVCVYCACTRFAAGGLDRSIHDASITFSGGKNDVSKNSR